MGWPKPLSSIPGVGKWTWGAGQGVFAETPNRVFILQRGMLPEIERPKNTKIAPSVEFPIGRLPWRDATSASPPGALFKPGTMEPGDDLDVGQPGVDYKWEHIISVVDAQGNFIEDWTQYDKMFRRPHSVFESPYDPQKDVWIVDDYRHAIFRFSNDGKTLKQTIGTLNVPGNDATHFYRPTFMAWQPNGDFYVADGYVEHARREVRQGRQVPQDVGREGRGRQGNAARLLQQRARRRRRSADGPRVRQRSRQPPLPGVRQGRQVPRLSGASARAPADIHLVYMDGSRMLWAFDRNSSKMLKYDLNGHFLYSWGAWGNFPGGFWGVHGMHVDSEGNFYVAEVDNGGAQKFKPRAGANPAMLLTPGPKPVGGTQ